MFNFRRRGLFRQDSGRWVKRKWKFEKLKNIVKHLCVHELI